MRAAIAAGDLSLSGAASAVSRRRGVSRGRPLDPRLHVRPIPGADPQKYPGGSGLGGVSGALYPQPSPGAPILPGKPSPCRETALAARRLRPRERPRGRWQERCPRPSTTRPRCPPLLSLPAPRPSPTGTMGHRAGDNRHDGASCRAGHSPEPGTGPSACTIKAAGRRNLASHGDLLTPLPRSVTDVTAFTAAVIGAVILLRWRRRGGPEVADPA